MKVTPEDTTGAGDAFLAGYLASLVKVRTVVSAPHIGGETARL